MTFGITALSKTMICHNAQWNYDECRILFSIMLSGIMMSVAFIFYRGECRYAECHYAECHYAECRYAECHYAECRYAECRYAECRGTPPHPNQNVRRTREY
jgi:hypothetical protein